MRVCLCGCSVYLKRFVITVLAHRSRQPELNCSTMSFPTAVSKTERKESRAPPDQRLYNCPSEPARETHGRLVSPTCIRRGNNKRTNWLVKSAEKFQFLIDYSSYSSFTSTASFVTDNIIELQHSFSCFACPVAISLLLLLLPLSTYLAYWFGRFVGRLVSRGGIDSSPVSQSVLHSPHSLYTSHPPAIEPVGRYIFINKHTIK